MYDLAANTWIWQSPLSDNDLEPLFEKIVAMGFDGVELPIENTNDFSIKCAVRALANTGLKPIVIGVMPENRCLIACDLETIRETQNYLIECLDIATAIGSRSLCGPFYSPVGRAWTLTSTERTEIYKELVENLMPIVDHAKLLGMSVGIETLNRYETSVLNTVEQALTALEPLIGVGLGLCLDTYHLQIEERSTAEAIKRAGGNIVHVQVCGNDRGAPGGDQTDWPGVFDALRSVQYSGALGIESFTSHNASIARAASIWRPLAPTQDDLARSGLAFLKESMEIY